MFILNYYYLLLLHIIKTNLALVVPNLDEIYIFFLIYIPPDYSNREIFFFRIFYSHLPVDILKIKSFRSNLTKVFISLRKQKTGYT
jgi:hypothetical protein